MEIIFVDDGSKDKTFSVVKSLASKMDISTKIFHQESKGLGSARNVVVDNAIGKYIVWVDGDMKLSRNFVRKQVEFMKKNASVGIGKGKYGMYQAGIVGFLENMEFMLANLRPREKRGLTPLGTGGCIYRVEAIKQVGGFDQNIIGSGEDADAEYRIKEAGWSLETTTAVFYERRRKTWKSLWNEYFWHGEGGQRILERNRWFVDPYKLFPPVAVTIELFRVCKAYKLVHQKVVLLLPLHYTFKRTAWFLGFVRGLIVKRGEK
jgi:glycosyltransferase involved in cell wall biosynthesis